MKAFFIFLLRSGVVSTFKNNDIESGE